MLKRIAFRQVSIFTLLMVPTAFAFGFWTGRNTERNSERPIAVNESLIIECHSEPELNTMVRVRQNKTISLALIGTVDVDGLTPLQLEHLVQDKYSDFLNATEIRIFRIDAITSQRCIPTDLL